MICDHVYLLNNQQERRPSSGSFAPGEFTKLFEEVLDTVDLIFRDGVDWKAFVSTFRDIQVQNDDSDLAIQSIENKGDGVVIVKVKASGDADKSKIHAEFSELYQVKFQALEEKYRIQLEAKDSEIQLYREKSTSMEEMAKLLAQRPIVNHVEAKAVAENSNVNENKSFTQTNHGGVNFQNDISGGQVNQGETINVANNPITNNLEGANIGNFANSLSDNASQSYSSTDDTSTEIDPNLTTILFLAANPISTTRLRLDEELREIDESLRRCKQRDQFNLINRGAVRSRDFYRAILDSQPKIVHFSGHGTDLDGLAIEDDQGNANFMGADQLAALFEMFAQEGVECVLLNACYSKAQAQAIRQHIPYVIGMNQAITDKAGIEFAVAFYDSLGAGKDVNFAFKLAKSQLIPFGEHKIPELL